MKYKSHVYGREEKTEIKTEEETATKKKRREPKSIINRERHNSHQPKQNKNKESTFVCVDKNVSLFFSRMIFFSSEL